MKSVLYFLGGAIVGAGVSFLVSRHLFNKKLDKEVKGFAKSADIYKKKQPEEKTAEPITPTTDISTPQQIDSYLNAKAEAEVKKKEYRKLLEPLSFEEASLIDWPEMEYSIYEDGVVTDANEHVIPNPESLFGLDYEKLFLNPDKAVYYFRCDILQKLIIVYKVKEPYDDSSDPEQLSYFYNDDEEED